jgi:cytochrome b subunit of formate dehydrogenase
VLFYATDININPTENIFLLNVYAMPILGIVAFIQNNTFIEINLIEKTIRNNVSDSRKDWNWIKNIDKLIKVEYNTDKQECKRVFGKKYIFTKMLVLSFNSQEMKYISVSLFSNNQINSIIKCLANEINANRN